MRAARNGKQVAVVIELKARFDEAANIKWASRMERAGIHVTYGVVGLKTHCKMILVVRHDHDGLRRYAHSRPATITRTPRGCTPTSALFTCDDAITRDLTELFNYLTTGYKPRRKYQKLPGRAQRSSRRCSRGSSARSRFGAGGRGPSS